MSSDASSAPMSPSEADADKGPLGGLPRINGRQTRLEHRLVRLDLPLRSLVSWLTHPTGVPVDFGRPEVLWRASGLARPGVIAQFVWPRLGTRLGLGIETALAHGVVDRLLGFERYAGEERLQVTPVEWGILTYVVGQTLTRIADRDGPFGPWDLTLDRVGPDPFDPHNLGGVVTLRWPLRVGTVSGSLRLWLPEPLVARWQAEEPSGARVDATRLSRLREVSSGLWHAEAGTAYLARGLSRLRAGGVLPIDGAPLSGTVKSPSGSVRLILLSPGTRYSFDADIESMSGGGRLVLKSSMHREPSPREPLTVTPVIDASTSTTGTSGDVPVTLTIELGRISLSLTQLADLKPGDVLELGRHAREPVELTSGGRLVARGELVQIDTELGVRVTNVLL
jgi:type III secretion system YscQ/HrcQ family protein